MARLSSNTLSDVKAFIPTYDRDKTGIGIVHFGPGAFHRAHQAVFTDRAIAKSGGDWGICAVSLNSRHTAEALTKQDGLYTLAIRDKSPSYKVIGAIKETLCARDEPTRVMDHLCAATTKIVTLTITEKGYALSANGRLDTDNQGIAADLNTPHSPVTAIGYLVEACRRRHAAGTDPLTIISCDNLPENGSKLRQVSLDYAGHLSKDLADHISKSVKFPNTMVDSITPATTDETLELVEDKIGLSDQAAIQRESFAQWVIEDKLPADIPDWEGAGAIITSDVHSYEMTKLRILNGAHSTLTYLGLMAGIETVEDAINNQTLRDFVNDLILHESIPSIKAPEGLSLETYWSQIIARFENPHIRHLLEQISHDGSQKIPARILPVIDFHAKNKSTASHACFVVAVWIEFNRTRRKAGNPPKDGYLDQIKDQLPDPNLPHNEYAAAFLELGNVFPDYIRNSAGTKKSILDAAWNIAEFGVLSAIRSHT